MKLKGKRIYIADDDEDVLEAMTMILEEEGADVVGVSDGKKIFTTVSFGDPDCILLDLYMPSSDGFDALQGLHEFLPLSCPILVVTGHPTEENIARAMELGATKCISKSFLADELVNTIIELIEAYQRQAV